MHVINYGGHSEFETGTCQRKLWLGLTGVCFRDSAKSIGSILLDIDKLSSYFVENSKSVLLSGNEAMSPSSCKTCGAPLNGPYCSQCGEKVIHPGDFAIRHFLSELANQFFLLDGRFLKSFWLLMARPGLLTREYFEGRRKPYLKPVQMFIIANVVYFFLQPYTIANTFNTTLKSHLSRQLYSPLARSLLRPEKIPEAELRSYVLRFDSLTHQYAKSLIFLMIPMLAGLLAVVNLPNRRYFYEYLIFSTHLFAFALLYIYSLFMLAYSGIFYLCNSFGWNTLPLTSELWSGLTVTLLLVAYLYPAFRKVFGMGPIRAALSTLSIPILMSFILFPLYRFILFLVVWRLMG